MNAIGLDLTTLAIVWITASIVLIPLLVLAVRFALLPLLETLARLRSGSVEADPGLAQRLASVESTLARVTRELEQLAEATGARAS